VRNREPAFLAVPALTQNRVFQQTVQPLRCAVSLNKLSSRSRSDYSEAEMRTGVAGFCSLPSNMAEPFNFS